MKKYFFLVGMVIIGLLMAGCEYEKDKKEDIIKYELKTSEYFDFLYNKQNKFFIDSEEELNKFYSLFSEQLNIDKNYLKNNTIFIQVRQVGSGSISMKLNDVTIENNIVNFSVIENNPQIRTDDMHVGI